MALQTLVCAVLILVLVVGMIGVNTLLPLHARMLNSLAGGFDRSVDNSKANTTGLDLQYNKPDYTSSSISATEDNLANRIAAEGVVLLENRENTPPLSTGTTFSFVSVNATKVSAEGIDLKTLFQNAGFGVNETLWNFYTKGDGKG